MFPARNHKAPEFRAPLGTRKCVTLCSPKWVASKADLTEEKGLCWSPLRFSPGADTYLYLHQGVRASLAKAGERAFLDLIQRSRGAWACVPPPAPEDAAQFLSFLQGVAL